MEGNLQEITIPTALVVDGNTDEQSKVMRYAEWLTIEAKRNNSDNHQEASRRYAEDALRPVTINGKEFRPFSPFQYALSAYKTLTRGQTVALSTIILGCGLGLLLYGVQLITAILAMITVVYLSSLCLDLLLTLGGMHLPPHFSIVTVPAGEPRTKPRACNFGLLQATGDYVVIYDAEDVPDPLQLKKAVLTFANHGSDLACVQAKLNYYNAKQNLLTRWFTVEYSSWFDLMLPGMQQTKLPLPLGGTSNHFRTETLRRVCAWDPFHVAED